MDSPPRTALRVMNLLAEKTGHRIRKSKEHDSAINSLVDYDTFTALSILRSDTWKGFFLKNDPDSKHSTTESWLYNKETMETTSKIYKSEIESKSLDPFHDAGIENRCRKMVNRIFVLWEELKIPLEDRQYLAKTLCNISTPPSSNHVLNLTSHLLILNKHRRATIDCLRCIEKREIHRDGLLDFLASYDKYIESGIQDYSWIEECIGRIKIVQIMTVRVIRMIQLWRKNLWRPYPFIWKRTNYLSKLLHDMDILHADKYLKLWNLIFPNRMPDLICVSIYEPLTDYSELDVEGYQLPSQPSIASRFDSENSSNWLKNVLGSDYEKISDWELLAAARVVQEEPIIQRSLKQEKEVLASKGLFIPTLKNDDDNNDDTKSSSHLSTGHSTQSQMDGSLEPHHSSDFVPPSTKSYDDKRQQRIDPLERHNNINLSSESVDSPSVSNGIIEQLSQLAMRIDALDGTLMDISSVEDNDSSLLQRVPQQSSDETDLNHTV